MYLSSFLYAIFKMQNAVICSYKQLDEYNIWAALHLVQCLKPFVFSTNCKGFLQFAIDNKAHVCFSHITEISMSPSVLSFTTN